MVTAVDPPPGSDGLVVRWVNVSAPDRGTMLAAIATPAGRPPFPTVLLHDRERQVSAELVIGADGVRSTVARLVGAASYRTGRHGRDRCLAQDARRR